MKKEAQVDQDKRLLYSLFFAAMNLDQAGFAAATQTSPSQVSECLRGKRTVPDAMLVRAADAARFPRTLIQPALRAIRSYRAATRGWSRIDKVMSEAFFADLLAWSGEALEAVFSAVAPAPPQRARAAPSEMDRELAAGLWLRLEPRNAEQRLAMVEEIEDFQNCALCELVAAKSIEMAPTSPASALELAELALRIAERCSADEWLSLRAQSYAWFHMANARRVTNDLRGSDVALDCAAKLWKASAPGGPGFFDPTWTFWIEATLRRAQRRFPEALERIEEALAADRGDLRGKLLLSQAQIRWALGDIEISTEVLREAILHVDEQRDPRTALGVRCQFLVNLCFQNRAAEAALGLPAAQVLAKQLGQDVDLVHVVFIAGKIAAGTGRTEEAEEAFEEARRRFAAFDPPLALDCAQVSLDLALLWLEQGRNAEVRSLAEDMAWIFHSQGVERDTLAALEVFCEAAKREAATVELARQVIRFLHQSQHDPGLKFEEAEAEQP